MNDYSKEWKRVKELREQIGLKQVDIDRLEEGAKKLKADIKSMEKEIKELEPLASEHQKKLDLKKATLDKKYPNII